MVWTAILTHVSLVLVVFPNSLVRDEGLLFSVTAAIVGTGNRDHPGAGEIFSILRSNHEENFLVQLRASE